MADNTVDQLNITSISRGDLKKLKKSVEDKQVRLYLEKEELGNRIDDLRKDMRINADIVSMETEKELSSLEAAYKQKSEEFRTNMDLLVSIESLSNEKEVGVSIGMSRFCELFTVVFNVGATLFMRKGGFSSLKKIPINLRNIFGKKFR